VQQDHWCNKGERRGERKLNIIALVRKGSALQKRTGMARVVEVSRGNICTPTRFIHERNEQCLHLPFQDNAGPHFIESRKDGRLSGPSWLVTYRDG